MQSVPGRRGEAARAPAPPNTSTMDLLSLSDDELLQVLAFLEKRDLLRCRGVCRRLRDLALHPHLWRHRSLSLDSDGLQLAAATLSVAPCLGTLNIGLAAWNQPCFPKHLIQKLSTFAGLRSLELAIRGILDESSVKTVCEAVCGLKGLQELRFFSCDNKRMAPLQDPGCPAEASLKRLFYFSPWPEPFLWSLLDCHAATLEEVKLGYDIDDVPVALLAKCRGLRVLKCNMLADMWQLAALPKLHTVEIHYRQDFPAGGREFLRRARNLREVALRGPSYHPMRFPCDDPWPPSTILMAPVSAMLALGESFSAGALKRLQLCAPPSGKVLAAVLPRLPSLEYLSLEFRGSEDFVHGIDPTSAPSLTTVSLTIPAGVEKPQGCWHNWLHNSALPGFLERNPRIHLEVKWEFLLRVNLNGCRNCPECLQGCHPGPWESRKTYLYSAHKAGCPLGCSRLAAVM